MVGASLCFLHIWLIYAITGMGRSSWLTGAGWVAPFGLSVPPLCRVAKQFFAPH